MAAMTAVTERARWLYLGYAGMVIFVVLEEQALFRTDAHGTPARMVLGISVVVVIAWLLLMTRYQRDRSSPVGPLLLVVVATGAIALQLLTRQGGSIIPAIVTLAMAANRFEEKIGLPFVVVATAAYLAAVAYHIGFDFITLISYATGLMFAYSASLSVRKLRHEEANAKALLAEVQANRDAQVQAAALNERGRIAREIHDVLAHTLAALAVQLESARVMLEQSGSNKEALATVERSHRLVKEGLEEVARAVSALRGDRIPGPSQLRELVNEFETDTGVESDFQVAGEARPLSPEADLALYRAAQEALTNVRKHADATRVGVALRYAADGTELRVSDVGTARTAAPNGGYGLVGMRERVELLGGTFDAGPTADGYEVRLWIPA
jgi:signal transduction histidine kinase